MVVDVLNMVVNVVVVRMRTVVAGERGFDAEAMARMQM